MEKAEAADEIKEATKKNQDIFDRLLLEMNSTQKRCVILWSLIAF